MCVETLTMDEIAEMCGYTSKVYVCKKIKQSGVTASEWIQTGGRRTLRYSFDDVAHLFPILATRKLAMEAKYGEPTADVEPVKKTRKPNSKMGKSEKIPLELEQKIAKRAFQIYILNSRRDGVKNAVEDACLEFREEIAEFDSRPLEKFTWYFYQNRIKENRGSFVGYYHSENWELYWKRAHDANAFNNDLPTAHYDYFKLLTSAGYLGEGFGAGCLWVMDGTQFNSFVGTIDENGKPTKRTVNYLALVDGATGFPIQFGLLEKGETIAQVAKILTAAVNQFGAPKLGIVADNGAAFKSNEIRNLIRSWYTEEELKAMADNKFRKSLFFGQTDVMLLPLPKMPRSPFKSRLEQMFNQFEPFFQKQCAVSYQGTRESRLVKYELGTVPTKAMKEAPLLSEAYSAFLYWIYTEFIHAKRNSTYGSFARATGLTPTAYSIWKWAGGKVDFSENLIMIDTIAHKTALPSVNKPYAIYAEALDSDKHEVKAGAGSVSIIHRAKRIVYNSPAIDPSLVGKPVTVIPNGDTCHIFKAIEKADSAAALSFIEGFCFLGIGYNSMIESSSELGKRDEIRKTRKSFVKKMDEFISESFPDASEVPYKIENKLGVSSYELATKPKDIQLTRPVFTEPQINDDNEDISIDDINDLINF